MLVPFSCTTPSVKRGKDLPRFFNQQQLRCSECSHHYLSRSAILPPLKSAARKHACVTRMPMVRIDVMCGGSTGQLGSTDSPRQVHELQIPLGSIEYSHESATDVSIYTSLHFGRSHTYTIFIPSSSSFSCFVFKKHLTGPATYLFQVSIIPVEERPFHPHPFLS